MTESRIHSQAERLRERTSWPGWQPLMDFEPDGVDWVAQELLAAQQAAQLQRALAEVPERHRAAYLAGRRAGRDDAAHLPLPEQVAADVVELLDRR